MEYLEMAKNEIRNNWFVNHSIKVMEGEEDFQRISFGEEGTRAYRIDYVFSHNMIFISGDLGEATISLTCQATLNNIKKFDLSYFIGQVTASSKKKWSFNRDLAIEQIKEYFLDWGEVKNIYDLPRKEKKLYVELINATHEWDDYQLFSDLGVWATYHRTDVDWFDSEAANCISKCGKQLSYPYIAYWLGLQMICEQLEGKVI